jgi:tetratricopeptide (TPR) repeat protein
MSYIHEALKKAQKEKDGHHHAYEGVASTPGKKLGFFSGKALWLAPLVLASLAFVVYLLLRSGDTGIAVMEPAKPKVAKETAAPITTEPARPKVAPRPKKVDRPERWYEKARAFHKRGRLQAAKRLYEKTLSVDPGRIDALNNLGVIQIQEGNYPAARTSFMEAIRIQPDYVDAHYNLACVDALGGEASQGLFHLRKAIEVDPAVKDWARSDADLDNLRGLPGFAEIVGSE